jgi:soluble lytic murein transglycosylase
MKKNARHTLVILLIICISILVGLLTSVIWNIIDKKNHPKKYSDIVEKYAVEYNIPDYVIYAIIKVESNFDASASSGEAHGLMQITPGTFEWLTGDDHFGEHLSTNKVYDPEVNIKYGVYYLKYLLVKFDYNWDTAFAAYNGGEGNVAKWLEDEKYSDGKGNLTKIPFSETENYVKKVNAAIDTYKKLY